MMDLRNGEKTIYEKLPTKLSLLWGVEYEDDIVYRKIMDKQAQRHDEFEVCQPQKV